jgi:hypothetical protein
MAGHYDVQLFIHIQIACYLEDDFIWKSTQHFFIQEGSTIDRINNNKQQFKNK